MSIVGMSGVNKRLGYLSGAPRVSTRPEAGASGPRTHVLGVINAFQKLGWEVRPYIVGDRVPLQWVIGDGSEHALRGSALRRIAADFIRLAVSVVHGRRALQEIGRVDWVYERYGAFQFMGWWFQRQGIPWILETNELYYVNAIKDRNVAVLQGWLKRQEQWAYRQCDVLVCISQPLAELIQREIGIPAEKIVVLPNGVDTERMDPAKAQPKRLFNLPTLGFVGKLQSWQRIDLLIEALAELREEGIDYGLVVVGDGPMREEWESYTRALGLSDRVRFVGRVPWEEVPSYIAGFDLGYAGAVPLAAGAMYLSPLKLYEYTAMGKPVVAAAYDDARHLATDGALIYLFKPGDQEDLKRVLRQAYTERESWSKYGARNRAVTVERHSWEARVKELIRRVSQILERRL